MMRVLVLVKASPMSAAGEMPQECMEKLLTERGKYDEERVAAGIMQSGDGLKPGKFGVRARFSGKERVVSDGPFAETRELVAGFRLWNAASKEEAVEWVNKCRTRCRTIRTSKFGRSSNPKISAKPSPPNFKPTGGP